MKEYTYAICTAVKDVTYLAEAIDSMKKQTYKSWHMYIYFNGSDADQMNKLIPTLNANKFTYFICTRALGASIPRNHIWNVATEDYMVILDGDDLLPEDYLEHINSYNNKVPDIDYSYPNICLLRGDEKQLYEKPDWNATYTEKVAIIDHQFMPFPGSCISKKFYKKERMEERWPVASDHDIAIKAALFYNVGHRTNHFYYRIHPDQISEARLKEQKDYDEEIKEHWKERFKKPEYMKRKAAEVLEE